MRLWTRLLLAVAVTVSMVGCGSSTTTSTSDGTKTPTAGTSPSPTPIELPDFISRMQEGSRVAFTATYVLPGYDTQVTVQQQLPKYYSATTFPTSTEIRVTDGTRQYVCQSDTKKCTSSSASLSIMDFAGYYVANYWIARMQQWPTQIPGQYGAVTITPSSTSLAGQPAECITYKNPSETAKICLFDSGVLASVESKDTSFFVTEFSPTVSPGIFAVPAGYVVTEQ